MDLSALLIGGSLWLNLADTVYTKDGKKKDLLLNEEAVYYWLLGNDSVTEKEFHEIKDAGQLSTLVEQRRISFIKAESKLKAAPRIKHVVLLFILLFYVVPT